MKSISTIFLILILLSFPSLVFLRIVNLSENSQYTPADLHDEISIQYGAFDDYGFSGSGTENNPYLLENQDIDHRLTILDSSDYFIIRNCRILAGLYLYRVSNGTIENCDITIDALISVSFSQKITIRDSVFTQPSYFDEKLVIWLSSDCKVIRNQFLDCTVGVSLLSSNNTIISNNEFVNNKMGLDMYSSINITVTENEFEKCGMHTTSISNLQYFLNMFATIANNVVNGKELGFFRNMSNFEIDVDQYGQVILLNCNNTRIHGGTLLNCTTGVRILHSNNCTIEDSAFLDCYRGGVDIYRSTNISLRNCHIAGNSFSGVLFKASPFFEAVDNLIENNRAGLSTSYNSDNGIVMNCVIRNNANTGLLLENNATAIGNDVSYNHDGIRILGSHCLIVNNTITYNTDTGIHLYHSSNYNSPDFNRIYGNDIGWNDGHNARDDGSWNSWDDSVSIGNSWSDYYGIGVYEVNDGSIDHYPSFLPEGGITPYILELSTTLTLIGLAVVIVLVILKKRMKPS